MSTTTPSNIPYTRLSTISTTVPTTPRPRRTGSRSTTTTTTTIIEPTPPIRRRVQFTSQPKEGLNSSHFLLVFIVVCLVIVVVMLVNVSKLDTTYEKIRHNFPGEPRAAAQRNCDVETVYSMNDDDCVQSCQPPGTFVTRMGRCVNALSFHTNNAEANKCNPKNGVFSYLVGDPQFGSATLQCLSIDPGVQPDNPNAPNTLCQNGTINVNYLQSFPRLSDCRCRPGHFLSVLKGTSAVRARGICVPNKMRPIFELNNLDYDPIVERQRSTRTQRASRAESPDPLESVFNFDGRHLTA